MTQRTVTITAKTEQDCDRIMLNTMKFKHANLLIKVLAQLYRARRLPEFQLYLAIQFVFGPKFRIQDVLEDDRVRLLTRTKSSRTLQRRLMTMHYKHKWLKAGQYPPDMQLVATDELFPDEGFVTPKRVTIRAADIPRLKEFVTAVCLGNIEVALPFTPLMGANGIMRPIYHQMKEGRIANREVMRLFGYKSRSMASKVKCNSLRGHYYKRFLEHLLTPHQIKGITYFEYLSGQTIKGGFR